MPIIAINGSNDRRVSIGEKNIGLTQAVIDRAGWKRDARIKVGVIKQANCVLLGTTTTHGYKLRFANTRTATGGKVECRKFIRAELASLVDNSLPIRNIAPIFPIGTDWDVAILLKPYSVPWKYESFSQTKLPHVDVDAVGVYLLTGRPNGVTLRIGQGQIRARIKEHMNNPRINGQSDQGPKLKVVGFCYLILDANPEDREIMERVLIAKHIDEHGKRPALNLNDC